MASPSTGTAAIVTDSVMCYQKVEGKIVFQEGSVYLLKQCPAHGQERVQLSDGIGAEDPQRVDLIRHDHRTEFSSNPRPHATAKWNEGVISTPRSLMPF
jgi:hypothetical protein